MKEIAGIKCYESQEAADILGVHYQTIRNLIKKWQSVYVYEDKLMITYNLLQREKAELFSIEQFDFNF